MIEISLCDVFKTYNPGLFKRNVEAVRGLSFDVHHGEVFGLIGPNGAGKSTTIRMLLGLIRPDSGHIHFRGKPLGQASIQSEIGYLPENPYLYDHLTLLELLNFCGQTSGLSSATIISRGLELMEKLDLLSARKRPVRTFSKGMLQRAGICFALLHDPTFIVLDEPMSGLDPIGRKMVFDLVMELRQQGKTIFFCSHILSDVERLCDRIGLMAKGRLIKEFSREEFLHNLGEMVFLQVPDLTTSQQDKLLGLGADIRNEAYGYLIAVPGDSYFSINDYLKHAGVEILGCQSEWMSLEELFMQNVKGEGQ